MANVNVTIRMNATFNMFAKQAIREQNIPFKIGKNTGIQFIDRNKLDELSEKSDEKYEKAHEKLAK